MKALSILLMLSCSLWAQQTKNILILNVDDLKPTLGCYGDKQAVTPQIDKLGSRGTVMLANYCQQAVCAATRVSMYTGLRPDSTGIHDLYTHMRDINPDVITLTEFYKSHGYQSVGYGKILHGAKNDDKPRSWTERFDQDLPYNSGYPAPVIGKFQNPELHQLAKDFTVKGKRFNTGKFMAMLKSSNRYYATESLDLPDDAYPDGAVAQGGIQSLQKFAKSQDPFCLVLGFRKPHLPFVAPKKYWDLYDRSNFELAKNQKNSINGLPYALHTYGELGAYADYATGKKVSEEQQRELIHGYYACVSFVDAQIGKVMAELDRLDLAKNTAVVLWGDHGWHLGDHGLWCKHSNFEQATAAPLIVVAPGMKTNQKTTSHSEFVDIFPTLCELTGHTPPAQLEGDSLVPILKDATAKVKDYSVSQYPRGGKIGYSLRAGRYRAVFWMKAGIISSSDFKEAFINAMELYDYKNDPTENVNQARNPEYASVRAEMTAHLKHFFAKYNDPAKAKEMIAKMKKFSTKRKHH